MVPPQMTTQGLPQIAFDGDHLWDNEQHCIKKIKTNTRGWAKPFFFVGCLFLFGPPFSYSLH